MMNLTEALQLLKPDIKVSIFSEKPSNDYDLEYQGYFIKYNELEGFRANPEQIDVAIQDIQTIKDNRLTIKQNKDFLSEYDYKVIKSMEDPKLYPLDKDLVASREVVRKEINDLEEEIATILVKYGQ